MKCPDCLREAPADAAFCPDCGTALRWACDACEAENAAAHRFCIRCGQRVAVAVGARVERDRQPVVLARRPTARARRRHRCPECRATSVDRDHAAPWLARALASVIAYRVYVCRQCTCRFYDRPIYPRSYD